MNVLTRFSRFGHREIIKFVLLHGPPPLLDMADHEKGHTALHKAAAYKRRTICCMLGRQAYPRNLYSTGCPILIVRSAVIAFILPYLISPFSFMTKQYSHWGKNPIFTLIS